MQPSQSTAQMAAKGHCWRGAATRELAAYLTDLSGNGPLLRGYSGSGRHSVQGRLQAPAQIEAAGWVAACPHSWAACRHLHACLSGSRTCGMGSHTRASSTRPEPGVTLGMAPAHCYCASSLCQAVLGWATKQLVASSLGPLLGAMFVDSPPVEGGDIDTFDVVLHQLGPLLTSLHSRGSARLQRAGCMVSAGKAGGHTTADTARQQQQDPQMFPS